MSRLDWITYMKVLVDKLIDRVDVEDLKNGIIKTNRP